jgi:hypothetical protein
MTDFDFTMKQTDTDPVIFTAFEPGSNTPVDLTGATTQIRARQRGGPSVPLPHVVEGSPVNGQLRWTPAGELGPGPWDYQIHAVSGTLDRTFPTVGSGSFLIEAPIPA